MITTRKITTFTLVVVGLMLALLLFGRLATAQTSDPGGAPSGSGTDPVFVAGNPTCKDLGYGDVEKKIDPPVSGTYPLDSQNSATVNIDPTLTFVDWTATLGIDAVLVKGGPNLDAFVYDPPAERNSDTVLHAPINPNTGKPFQISHVNFCFDYELLVNKTAKTSFTRTFKWMIDKSVKPATWNLFRGDSGTSEYTVKVTKDAGTDSNWAVNGTITVKNPSPFTVPVAVKDTVSGTPAIPATVDCGGATSIAPGATLQCTYQAALPDGSNRTNKAEAISGRTATPPVDSGQATAAVDFSTATINKVNDSITVDDTYAGAGSPWTFSTSGAQTYTRTFSCDGDQGTHDNTATISPASASANPSDSASVQVNCYDLKVSKDAQTSLTRTYNWTIDKSADQSNLTLSVGQQFFPVNYSVKVNATPIDSKHAVSGKITITNPAPIAAKLTAVTDVISPDISADVQCPSHTVPAKGSLECSYSATGLPGAQDRTNTATATLKNFSYDAAGIATPVGTTDFSGSAPVSFANASVNEIDESITVSDTLQGALGSATANDPLPKVFTYQRAIGPFGTPGVYNVDNTASFVTNDTKTTGSDSWRVVVNVPAQGCTLTIGYWKTHADPTSNRTNPNATGALLPILLGTPSGAKSVNVTTTTQAVKLLSFSGDASNGINKLYAQLLAAKLNIKNGAGGSAVSSTISAADAFLANNNAANWAGLSRAQKNTVLGWATTLDNYNNGLIGPGHCDE